MRFKKLELLGFKSFCEPTELLFEPGITAVVGPNGCGKSNIADAIKWVLGEQSARELRGGRMEDLIFNGTDRRDPVNYAEVSLTLDNSDKRLAIDYSEITISRRLYRSGESEYLLNRSPVRLKDISELLMGTGIGTSAYSLFEQGRIEQIIGARPEDRRAVFEEAAGITKFKTQKREALRKLEDTEANLLRVSDVIAEVKRQIQALERQVKRARAYREQFDRLKQLEVALARHEGGKLSGQQQSMESSLAAVRAEAQKLTEQLNGQERNLSSARQAVSAQDESLNQARGALLSVTHRQQTSESNLQLTRERLSEGRARAASAQEELSRAEGKMAELRKEMGELQLLVDRADGQRRSKEQELQESHKQLEECARAIEEAQRKIAQTQEQILEAANQQSGLRNELGKIRQENMRAEARLNRLTLEETKVAAELSDQETQVKSLEQALTRVQEAARSLAEERSARRERFNAVEAHLAQLKEKSVSLERERARVGSQLELLNGFLTSHEGYDSGVKTLLTALDQNVVSREGISGVLAELLQVSAQDAAAVDAALGPFGQALVVDSAEVAERCRRHLDETKAGRVLFLIRDKVPAPSKASDAPSGGAVSLAQRVGITPHLAPLIDLLLADTWLVSDREEARRLAASASPFSSRAVTPSGELFTPASALLGSAPLQEAIVIGRRSRLESLEIALAQLETQWAEVESEFKRVSADRSTHEEQLLSVEKLFQEKMQEMERSQANFSSASAGLAKLIAEEQLLRTEKTQVQQELEGLRSGLHNWQQQLNEKDAQLAVFEETAAASEQAIARHSKKREDLSVQGATLAAELDSFEQVTQSRRSSLYVLEETFQAAQAQGASRREELARLAESQAKWEGHCKNLEASMEELKSEETQAAASVARAEGLRRQGQAHAEALEREFQAASRRMEDLNRQLHEQEMEQAKVNFEKQQIADRLLQVYGVNLQSSELGVGSLETPNVELQRGEAKACSELSEEQLTQHRQEVLDLQSKLQKMGPVNLASIDEEQELKMRYEHLVTQQGDLTRAKEDLHEAITKINRTTRAMFRETFEAVQKEFQITFKQLFGGGEARLVLLDEEDLLESGIEIIARPPGKTVSAISLLSGGEKALTTIALLFAIFRIKPSPFCLMDEVDAPLDESNVTRFAGALREFLKESQFIIITHNKKTITMADLMYGITMQESGVSKIVSVKFKENGANGNGNGAHAVPLPSQRPSTQAPPTTA